MKIADVKKAILEGKYDKTFAFIYPDSIENVRNRYVKACDNFLSFFGDRDNIRIFSAPGRTEVGGNHTDHQHGRVLAGSVNLDVIAIVSENSDNIIRIESEGYKVDPVDLKDLEARES